MTGKEEMWSILILIVVFLVGGYLLAWRGKQHMLRRAASLALAIFSGLVAYFCTRAYAIPDLREFHSWRVSLETAVLDNLVSWAFCLATWLIAIRFTIFSLRKPNSGGS